MTNRVFYILTALLHLLIFCRSQLVNYECDFNAGLIGDCIFTATDGGLTLTTSTGAIPSENPRQPLSDASVIQSRTKPNNEPCILPYSYTPGNWQMYFCTQYSPTNFTCPTASGVGQCFVGRYGAIRMPSSSSANYRYLANVQRSSNTVQCLDFYYYITDTSENSKLQAEWKKDEDTQKIVEVTALSENKWQHSRTEFTLPSSLSSYQIVFRTLRDKSLSFPAFYFALDEIKIYDDSCDNIPTTTTPIPPMTIIDASTTVSILPDTTIPSPATTVTIPPAGSTHTSTMKTSPLTDLFLSTISTQIDILKTSPYPSSITMQENTSTSITFAVNTNVTTTETPIITSSPPPETNSNLAFILALALGIPTSLGVFGGIFYYFKVIKPKHRFLVNGTGTTTDIPMAPTSTTSNDNPTVTALVA